MQSCKAFAGQEAKKEAASNLHHGESVDGDRLPLLKDGE